MSGIVSSRGRQVAAGLVVIVLLAGCAQAAPAGTPTAGNPTATADLPPLDADLTGGVAVQLGGEGHWVIDENRAFVADANGVDCIDLTTGATLWRAKFPSGRDAWDAQPTVGLTADGATVLALRTVDASGGSSLELLTVTAASGAVVDDRLVADPEGRWRVDLPPRILAADAATMVVAENPEWGTQVATIELPSVELGWLAEEQAFAAADNLVITRNGALDRLTGERQWESSTAIGPLVALTADAAVMEDADGRRVLWLDPGTGEEFATTPSGDADVPQCLPSATAVVCLGSNLAGYDLTAGAPLWTQQGDAAGITTYRDWVYVWRDEQRGDVLDARTGQPLVSDAVLPAIRFSNEAGVLVDRDGYHWIPVAR